MRKPHADAALIMAFVLIAVMVIGEASLYLASPYSFSSDVYRGPEGPEYSFESSGAADFSVVQTDPGEFEPPTDIYIYDDPSYGSFAPSDAEEDLVTELRVRGMECTPIDTRGLVDLVSGDPSGKAIVFLTGALPSDVYSGSPDDPIVRWVAAGGSLYWMGQVLGAYISLDDGTVREVEGGDSLFFGDGSFNSSKSTDVGETPDAGLGSALCIRSSNAQYGMSVSVPDCLSLGYVTDDGYGSVCTARYGDGMISVVGGTFYHAERKDMAQLIASGVTYSSDMVLHQTVVSDGGRHTGALEDVSDSIVYIFAGGDFTSYGCRHTL